MMFIIFIIVWNSVVPFATSKLFVSMLVSPRKKSYRIANDFQGEYYCVNEGFTPRSNDNLFLNYTSELKSSKENPFDRKINGTFYLKQDVTNIGVIIHKF